MANTNVTEVKYEKKSNILGEFVFRVGPEEMRSRMQNAFSSLQKKAKVPGFREGKVPLDVVKRKFHEDVLHDVFQRLVWESYRNAAVENKVPAVGDPRITETNLNDWEDGKQLQYTAQVDLLPDVTIKKYKGLPVTENSATIKQEDIDIVVKNLLEPRSELINLPSETRVALGHFVMIDFAGSLDGLALPDANAKNFMMEVGGKGSLESFRDGVIGMKAGESKEIEVPYPTDFNNKEVAGKSIKYKVDLLEVKEKRYPEITDEIAKDFQAASKQEMLDRIRTSLETELEVEKKQQLQEEILVALLEANPLDVPPSLTQRQLQFIMQDLSSTLKAQRFSENLIRDYFARHWEEISKRAEREVRIALLLPKVAELEKITVNDEELKEYLKQRSASTRQDFAAQEKVYFGSDQRKDELRNEAKRAKAVDIMVKEAKVTKAKK